MKYALAIVLAALTVAHAQPRPKAGQTYKTLQFDLNGDGQAEKIGLTAYGFQEGGYYGRLKVWSPAGKLLWQAPLARKINDPFAFGSWEFGSSTIDYIGDIDGDGKIELISARPQSDVRPATFNRYRWTGNSFSALPSQMLLQKAGQPDTFVWSKPFEWDGEKPLTWIIRLSGKAPTAEVFSYGQGATSASGEAQMKGSAAGLTVQSWTRKMSSQ